MPFGESVAYVVPKLDTDTFEQPQTEVMVNRLSIPECPFPLHSCLITTLRAATASLQELLSITVGCYKK